MTRPELPPMPPRIARLRVDPKRGYPVPWFVAWIDGVPDFRVVDRGKREEAVTRRVCWICGEPLGAYKAFVIGPMCAINRTSSEPPCHRDCAIFAAQACPFLVRPHMRRRDNDLPGDVVTADGVGLQRNPGVALVWVTRSYGIFRDGRGGWLIEVGDPTDTLWFAEGRAATRDEVVASIDSGYPLLLEVAQAEGSGAVEALAAYRRRIEPLLPSGAP